LSDKVKKAIAAVCCATILLAIVGFIMPELTGSDREQTLEVPDYSSKMDADETIEKLTNQVKEIKGLDAEKTNQTQITSTGSVELPVTISFFDDILGFSGYCKDTLEFEELYVREYYSGLPGSEGSIKLGESWNFQIDNYVVDVNNDGINELICNCMAHMSGHREVIVFRWNGSSVEIGYVDWLKYGIDNLFYWGHNAVQTEYDSVSGKIRIDYCPREGNQEHSSTMEVGFDWISFEEWDEEDYPGIDIERAYELYGEQ